MYYLRINQAHTSNANVNTTNHHDNLRPNKFMGVNGAGLPFPSSTKNKKAPVNFSWEEDGESPGNGKYIKTKNSFMKKHVTPNHLKK